LAELGAAIHGVHRGARGEIVRFWLRRALTTWPAARRTLIELLRARICRLDPVLLPFTDPHLDQQQGWSWTGLDAELLAAAEEVLATPLPELLSEPPGEEDQPLATPLHVELWQPLDRCWAEVLPAGEALPRLGVQSFFPRTDLALWIDPSSVGRCLELSLVLRVVQLAEASPREIILARTTAADEPSLRPGAQLPRTPLSPHYELPSTPTWRRHAIHFSPQKAGLERWTLHWPAVQLQGEEAFDQLLEDLRCERSTHLAPVFGEISNFRLRRVVRAETQPCGEGTP
jgi:hypothetical protein